MKKEGVKIELIFATSDQNDKAFKEYFAEHGNWLAFEYGDNRIESTSTKYGVQGIPTLIVIDAKTGKTIDTKGRMTVASKKGQAYKEWIK